MIRCMIFWTLSVTNHWLTSLPIFEGIALTDDTFIISASSRSSNTSGVATNVPTPTPDPEVEAEADENNDFGDEGDGSPSVPPLSVLASSPKFKTSLFVDDDGESSLSFGVNTRIVEKFGDRADDTGDVGGVGADEMAGSTTMLFMQISARCFFDVDTRRVASTGVS